MIAQALRLQPDPADDRRLPHDADAERALLGSMLLSNDAMGEAAELVSAEAFAEPRHAEIWAAFIRANRAGSPADIALIAAELNACGKLEQVGGLDALVELAESVPTAANWRWYARAVMLAYWRRRLICAAHDAMCAGFAGEDISATIDALAAELGALQAVEKRQPERVKSILPRVLDEIFSAEATGGRTFGLAELDAIVSPMRPGQLHIVGASTRMGKTALALTIAGNLARSEVPSLVVSLEMSIEELAKRLIAAESRVPVCAMIHPSKRDTEAIALATGRVETMPIDLHYAPGATVSAIANVVKTWAGRTGGGLVVVDYLQLMRDPGHRVREAEVAACSRGLKALAGEAGVTIIAPSQLNREIDRRDSRLPRLSDLRESGAIEQDADVVMLLHRNDAVRWTERDYIPDHLAQVLIAKQRNGATGLAVLGWDGASMTFHSRGPGASDSAPSRRDTQLQLAGEEIPI